MGGKATRINTTVVGVLLVIAFIYFIAVFRVIIPWFENSVPGVLNLGIITINTALSVICYIQCVYSNPGKVPEDWKPDEEVHQVVVEVKKKGGGARFCQKCQLPKPPRCHHCRVCKRCVLRMDHHCPWVNNCIGHGNYKAFFLFLIYVTAAAIHAMGLQCMYGLNQLQANRDRRARAGFSPKTPGFKGDHAAAGWALAQTLCFTLTFPVTLGLIMLLGWHIYLVINNKTTIEYHEGVTAKIQAAKVGRQWKHPYDLGLCGNLHGVLGSSAALWLLPIPRSAEGDGLSFVSGIEPL